MNFLEIKTDAGKEAYLSVLDDFIVLLQEFRKKIKEEDEET